MNNKSATRQQAIDSVVEILKECRSILFITGAGISADSGLPTYRGVGGLYEENDTEDGMPVESALSAETIVSDPSITWKYLSQIERNCRGATFNRAHEVITEMQNYFDRVWILTQNIDGFHTAAGSINTIEIHGNVFDLKCMQCDWRQTVKDYSALIIPPACPQCSAFIRPDVVLFGEMLDTNKLQLYMSELHKGFDLYVWIGTTGVFPYIQSPLYELQTTAAKAVEINPDHTVLTDDMDVKIPLGAAEALDLIWGQYGKQKNN